MKQIKYSKLGLNHLQLLVSDNKFKEVILTLTNTWRNYKYKLFTPQSK